MSSCEIDCNANGVETKSTGDDSSMRNERLSCKFGVNCFRQNPKHRLDMSHPGDVDYITPSMPKPNKDAGKCKYGRKCYRLNPEHFQNFTHPRNINMQQNYKKYILYHQKNKSDSDSNYDSSDNDYDPFAGDSDDPDYIPSEEDK